MIAAASGTVLSFSARPFIAPFSRPPTRFSYSIARSLRFGASTTTEPLNSPIPLLLSNVGLVRPHGTRVSPSPFPDCHYVHTSLPPPLPLLPHGHPHPPP